MTETSWHLTPTRTEQFIQGLNLLARAILAILLVSVFAAALPLRPWDPLWYLKIGQISIDYSYIFLFVVLLALFAKYYRSQDMKTAKGQKTFINWLLATGFVVYSLLVPIQLFSISLYWVQSDEQVKQALRTAESELETMRSRIRNVNNTQQLLQLFGAPASVGAPTMAQAPTFATEQGKALKSVDDQLLQLRARLRQERQTRLTALTINTAKGIIGTAILAFVFSRLRGIQKSS